MPAVLLMSQLRSVLLRSRYRVLQFAHYAVAPSTAEVDRRLRRMLTLSEWTLVARLPAGDRAHLLAVRQRLEAAGGQDADVLKAALLHDVGKADDRTRVYLMHRVLAVLLGHVAPGLLEYLAQPEARGWRRGFYLARAHSHLGAAQAQAAGCSERVCWLIAHHHDPEPVDAGLRLLQAVDEGEIHRWL